MRLLAYAALAVGALLAGLLAGVATGTARLVGPGLPLLLATVFAALVAASILLSRMPVAAKLLALALLGAGAAGLIARLSPRIALALLLVAAGLALAYLASLAAARRPRP